jgi:hypothetical protein
MGYSPVVRRSLTLFTTGEQPPVDHEAGRGARPKGVTFLVFMALITIHSMSAQPQ